MKVCPFCQAKIEDNARFCLYCMTPLNEKQVVEPMKEIKRLWPWLSVVLLTLLLAASLATGGILWALGKLPPSDGRTTSQEKPTLPPNVSASERTYASGELYPIPTEGETVDGKGAQTGSAIPGGSTTKGKPHGTTGQTAPTAPTSTTKATQKTTKTTRSDQGQAEQLTWYYRKAYSGDHYNHYNKVDTVDGIVVTGFDRIPENGIYQIPATIDGKTVVGVNMLNSQQGYTFASPEVARTAKAIYLPPAVNRITYNLFSSLVNLTDLYIAGEYLYLEPGALPPQESRNGTLTFHASQTCWCLYGSKVFSTYCSVNGYNAYRVQFSLWTDSVY